MKKNILVVMLVMALAVVGLGAKDLGIKVGGELGWGVDIAKLGFTDDEDFSGKYKAINNGFAANVTGEYDFNDTWGIKATFGMMFAGKTTIKVWDSDEGSDSAKVEERAGLYIDFAVDCKYSYAINDKISVSGLAGVELVHGNLAKIDSLGSSLSDADVSDSTMKNTAVGVNGAFEGSYKVTDKITVTGGVSAAWFFINTSKFIDFVKSESKVKGVASFYIRPYVGATYSF